MILVKRNIWGGLVVSFLMTITATQVGCGKSEENEDAASVKKEPDAQQREETKYMPFSIKLTMDGEPVLIDDSGRELEPQKLEYPIKSTSIVQIESITLVRATGSHFYVVKTSSGKQYKVMLPHY